jgi:hypothetical protein
MTSLAARYGLTTGTLSRLNLRSRHATLVAGESLIVWVTPDRAERERNPDADVPESEHPAQNPAAGTTVPPTVPIGRVATAEPATDPARAANPEPVSQVATARTTVTVVPAATPATNPAPAPAVAPARPSAAPEPEAARPQPPPRLEARGGHDRSAHGPITP